MPLTRLVLSMSSQPLNRPDDLPDDGTPGPDTPSSAPSRPRLMTAADLAIIAAGCTEEETNAILLTPTPAEAARMAGRGPTDIGVVIELVQARRKAVILANAAKAEKKAARALLAEAQDTAERIMALKFAADNKDALRYVTGRGWHRWDPSQCWTCNGTDSVVDIALDDQAAGYHQLSFASRGNAAKAQEYFRASRALLKKQTRENVLSLAAKELSKPGAEANLKDHLIPFLNGTLDSTTMKLRPHDPEDFFTWVLPVAYNSDAKAPLWREMIGNLTCGDWELESWLHRFCGLLLTGYSKERLFVMLTGVGRNYKGTLTNGLRWVLAPCTTTIRAATITETRGGDSGNGPSPDIADLIGMRFAPTGEIKQGARLNDERIKELTSGGDTIKGRFLNANNLEFPCKAKLMASTQHLPRSLDISPAMKDRIRIIPCLARITDEMILARPYYELELKAEMEGIAAWMVEGLVAYLAQGLRDADFGEVERLFRSKLSVDFAPS